MAPILQRHGAKEKPNNGVVRAQPVLVREGAETTCRKQPVKSLDKKLKTIAAGKYKPADFILADAKDPDYAFGVKGTGAVDYLDQSGPHRSIPDFRQSIRDIVRQKQMDVMLGAVANIEPLVEEGLFDKSGVTPAIRANDTTDIWLPRGAQLFQGAVAARGAPRTSSMSRKFCDLGLYSVTFNNDLDHDYATVEAYRAFREDAVKHKFRHFLEVFNPNAPQEPRPEGDALLRERHDHARAGRHRGGGAPAVPQDAVQWQEGDGGTGEP